MISKDASIINGGDTAERLRQYYLTWADELCVIIFSNHYEYKDLKNGLHVYTTGGNVFTQISKAIKLGKKITENNKEWIITTQDPFETGLVGRKISLENKIPWVAQIHTDIGSPFFRKELKNKIRYKIAKKILKYAQGARVVSERIQKFIIKKHFIDDKSILVAPIYPETKIVLDNNKNENNKEIHILMASRLTKEKNILLALRAIKNLRTKIQNFTLTIKGKGPQEKKIKKFIKDNSMNSYVKIEEWSSDLSESYKNTDIFLLTSNYEGFGRTVIEAMTYGITVIMTDVGCAGWIIKTGENGIVVPVGSCEYIENSLKKLITDNTLCNKIKEAGKRTAENLPEKEKYLEEFGSFFKKIYDKQ